MSDCFNEKQIILFKSFQLFRLQKDMEIIEDKLIKNVKILSDVNDNFFKKITINIGNKVKDCNSEKLSEKKIKVQERLEKFKESNSNLYESLFSFNSLNDICTDLFENDEYGLCKILFAISIILDNEIEYEYGNESLKQISNVLFGDYTKMESMKKQLEEIYKDIAKKPLGTKQKGILTTVGIASLAIATTVTIMSIGGLFATAPATTAALALIGFQDMQLGVGMVALYSVIFCGTLLGATYMSLNNVNKQNAVNEFRKMNFEEAALMLTIKCFVISESKKILTEEELKEEISDLLSMISDFKSDTDYVLFVEKQNIEENKNKLLLFHNFYKKMVSIFGY